MLNGHHENDHSSFDIATRQSAMPPNGGYGPQVSLSFTTIVQSQSSHQAVQLSSCVFRLDSPVEQPCPLGFHYCQAWSGSLQPGFVYGPKLSLSSINIVWCGGGSLAFKLLAACLWTRPHSCHGCQVWLPGPCYMVVGLRLRGALVS